MDVQVKISDAFRTGKKHKNDGKPHSLKVIVNSLYEKSTSFEKLYQAS